MGGREFEVEEGKEVVGRTIVGGRPRARKKRKLRIPIGIEKVLCRAAADGRLKASLLDRRESALDELAHELTEAEREVLESIPGSSLQVMIDQIDLKRHPRRKFMRGVMAASFLAASATTMLDCTEESATMGIGPDSIEPEDTGHELPVNYETVAGIAPDVIEVIEQTADAGAIAPTDTLEQDETVESADVLEQDDFMAVTGIMPDSVE